MTSRTGAFPADASDCDCVWCPMCVSNVCVQCVFPVTSYGTSTVVGRWLPLATRRQRASALVSAAFQRRQTPSGRCSYPLILEGRRCPKSQFPRVKFPLVLVQAISTTLLLGLRACVPACLRASVLLPQATHVRITLGPSDVGYRRSSSTLLPHRLSPCSHATGDTPTSLSALHLLLVSEKELAFCGRMSGFSAACLDSRLHASLQLRAGFRNHCRQRATTVLLTPGSHRHPILAPGARLRIAGGYPSWKNHFATQTVLDGLPSRYFATYV